MSTYFSLYASMARVEVFMACFAVLRVYACTACGVTVFLRNSGTQGPADVARHIRKRGFKGYHDQRLTLVHFSAHLEPYLTQ
jgi:hypothetical protein